MRYFEAIGRDAGVVVYRCPHKHKTADAAHQCGVKRFVFEYAGQEMIESLWWNGGVREMEIAKGEEREVNDE